MSSRSIATLRLRLSDQPGLDEPTFSLALRSAAPFALADSHCGDGFSHTVTDGEMLCQPDGSAVAAPRRIVVRFSSAPAVPDIVLARDVLRIDPPVDGLTVDADGGDGLTLGGRFAADTAYTLSIDAGAIGDGSGRTLAGPAGTPRRASPSGWARRCCRCTATATTAPTYASTRSTRWGATSGRSRARGWSPWTPRRRRCRGGSRRTTSSPGRSPATRWPRGSPPSARPR